MSYVEPFLRLVVIGKLFNVEDFTYSLSMIEDGSGTGSPPDEVPQAVLTAVTNFHATTGLFSIEADVTAVKLNEIGTDGRYTSNETVWHEFVTPIQGAGSAKTPAQVALAITLDTDAARGLAHAGRFYTPLPIRVLQTNGGLSAADQAAYADAAKAFLDALNLAVPGYQLGVVSNVGTGAFRTVTGLRVGAVYDTIRSRREKLAESYLDRELDGFVPRNSSPRGGRRTPAPTPAPVEIA